MSSARIILNGKLSMDAAAKTSDSGKAYCRLAMALKHLDMEKQEHWVWYNVTLFGRDADTAALRKKGDGVTIVGRQTPKLGKGKDGTPKVSVDVIADSVDWHEWMPLAKPDHAKEATADDSDLPF